MNKCTAQYNNMEIAHEGVCGIRRHHHVHDLLLNDKKIMCQCEGAEFKPLCSLAGFTYENQCVLRCSQQISLHNGPCKVVNDCKRKYRPACGVDGLTYDNECTMKAIGVQRLGYGECPSLFKFNQEGQLIQRQCEFCSKVFMPACGKNGKTYRNLCKLMCHQSHFAHFGQCTKKE